MRCRQSLSYGVHLPEYSSWDGRLRRRNEARALNPEVVQCRAEVRVLWWWNLETDFGHSLPEANAVRTLPALVPGSATQETRHRAPESRYLDAERRGLKLHVVKGDGRRTGVADDRSRQALAALMSGTPATRRHRDKEVTTSLGLSGECPVESRGLGNLYGCNAYLTRWQRLALGTPEQRIEFLGVVPRPRHGMKTTANAISQSKNFVSRAQVSGFPFRSVSSKSPLPGSNFVLVDSSGDQKPSTDRTPPRAFPTVPLDHALLIHLCSWGKHSAALSSPPALDCGSRRLDGISCTVDLDRFKSGVPRESFISGFNIHPPDRGHGFRDGQNGFPLDIRAVALRRPAPRFKSTSKPNS
ncbi:hypothetical protein C8R46DRAFT_1194102 [Mycena filopes]|nr:hypothetical protein C8R46DRAFT_1194102 [Mycena filopes]